ncbi:MAG: nitrate reductase [Opitutales bacterium]|nr:nitrate reductase [Opitutales bacterium]
MKNTLLRSWTGPLTERLVRAPGEHGLGQVPAALKPDTVVPSVCGFCSTGCSLSVHLKDGEAVNLSANPGYPVNLGMACPKGWEALAPLAAPDRATTPLLRKDDSTLAPVDWDTAMRHFVDRFKTIQREHGPDALAWLGTGQIPTEELAFLGALAKFGMGIRHGDGNTRQCMATAVTAYKQSFGFDAPPYTYADFEESDVLVFVGSNLCIAHPILWQRVLRNKRSPEIVVIDPRTTETAMAATSHFAIRPKSDLSFFYALAHQILRDGSIDREFLARSTTGFDEFAAFLAPHTPARAAEASGIPEERIIELARLIGSGKRVSFWWTMGVNQSYEGTRVAQALINLALMTGNIGKPGTGANSITGQCNAMGSRLFSNTTGLLGGRDFTNPAHRAEVARILELPADTIPDENSLGYDQIIDGIEAGRIKGLWIVATNSAHSWIQQNRCNGLLDKLDCLVVQDMYASTETAQAADIVLPAAGWGEKDGTFINSERRIGRIRKVRRAPGQALADFHIFQLLARYWGCADRFARWESPEAVFHILRELSAGQPCDISGIEGYDHLDTAGGIQWPYANSKFRISNSESPPPPNSTTPQLPDSTTERRLFADGRFHHADGRARFLFDEPRPLPEAPCADFPFTLLTGRGTSAQWHTQTRTAKSDVLRKLYPQNIYVEINLTDAVALGIRANDPVTIRSRRGELTAAAHLCHTVQPGQIFIPMHYRETNRLTHSSFDPHSRQPNYKACAVQVLPAARYRTHSAG